MIPTLARHPGKSFILTLPGCILLSLIILCTGCASEQQTRPATQPLAGLKPRAEREELSVEQIVQMQMANVVFTDWYLARLAAACDQLAQSESSPEARSEAMRLKANQAASVYSIVTGPSPIVQALNLHVLVELTELKWAGEGRAKAIFGERGKILIDALGEIKGRAHDNALRAIPEEELSAIPELVRSWRAANREINDIEFIRFEDFAAELAHTLAPQLQSDLMSTMRSAASGLSETRLLGVRALHLFSRMPRIMQWQFEAQLNDVAQRPDTRSLLDNLTQLARTADQLKQQVAGFQGTLDAHPQRLADALMNGAPIKEALASASQGVLRAETATKQLAAVEASVRGLDSSLGNLTRQLDVIMKTYDPATVERMAQGGTAFAIHEARAIIFLVTACIAGLLLLHALLRRWSRPS